MNIRKILSWLSVPIVVLLSCWSFQPIFITGFFPIHDHTQVARVFEIGKVLKEGVFPVRWVPDLGYGYGYPVFNFYAPFAYYIGGILNLVGFDALLSTKLMMAIGVLLSGITMYFFAKEFLGKLGGIISALFYVYAPYHAVNIYVRGAVAEYFAYAFIPLVFLGLYKVFWVSSRLSQSSSFKNRLLYVLPWLILGAVGYAGVILSHNLTAMMTTPFLGVFVILLSVLSYRKNLFTIYFLIITLLLGIILSSFYWMPAILEMKYTNVSSQVGGSADFHEHFVCFSQLWHSPWGFGGSTVGCTDGLSLKVGKLHLILALIGFVVIFFKKKSDIQKTIIFLMVIFLLLSMLFTTNASRFLWEAVKPMEYIQYPWRFLALASFFASFLLGNSMNSIDTFRISHERKQIGKMLIFVSFIVILIASSTRIFQPQTIFQTKSSDFTNESALKWTASKTSDEYMPKNFHKPASSNEIVKETLGNSPNIRVSNIIENSHSFHATVEVLQPTVVILRKAPFPAWELFIQGKKQSIEPTPDGYLLQMPPGVWSLYLKYRSTQIQQIANMISVAGITVVIIGIIYLVKLWKGGYFYEKTEG